MSNATHLKFEYTKVITIIMMLWLLLFYQTKVKKLN